jgi:hypothetical protein
MQVGWFRGRAARNSGVVALAVSVTVLTLAAGLLTNLVSEKVPTLLHRWAWPLFGIAACLLVLLVVWQGVVARRPIARWSVTRRLAVMRQMVARVEAAVAAARAL